jgi:hypothetical protein
VPHGRAAQLTQAPERSLAPTDITPRSDRFAQVSWEETDWAIETADVDGNGELDREELRAAVSWW